VNPVDDTELYRELILRQAGPVITGRFLGYRESYTRDVRIAGPLLLAVFLAALVARLAGVRGGRRRLRELKKGPEYLVTPVRLRDALGQVYEVELHGHLPQSALHAGDLVQVTTRPQHDPGLPVKLVRVVNLTTLQPFTPRIPTRWTHLGPALLIQALLGAALAAAVAAAAWGA
jgi:hypothetical protein